MSAPRTPPLERFRATHWTARLDVAGHRPGWKRTWAHRLLAALGGLTLGLPQAAAQPCPQRWTPRLFALGGLDGEALAWTVWDDGSEPALYVGGDLRLIGDRAVSSLVRWNGREWSMVSGELRGTVRSLTVHNGELIVSGDFVYIGSLRVNYIARWDGRRWATVATGLAAPARAMAVYNGELVVGGQPGLAPPVFGSIARWSGGEWKSMGWLGGPDGPVRTMTIYDGELIVGGTFLRADLEFVHHIARWNGTRWLEMESGVDGNQPSIDALAVYRGDLIAGGSFAMAGYLPARNIAHWNGHRWTPLGEGLNGSVSDLEVFGDTLIVAGPLSTPDGALHDLVQWDGSGWSAVGGKPDGSVRTLMRFGSELIISGSFRQISSAFAARLARWDGQQWRPMVDGLSPTSTANAVLELGTYAGDLIVAGALGGVDAQPLGYIARWHPQIPGRWVAMGPGTNGYVVALQEWGGDLIVGGQFTRAGDVEASRVARWDGTGWHSLGPGVNGLVSALAIYGGELVVGGTFTQAGSVPANCIARWNGLTWQPLGSGLGHPSAPWVGALLAVGDDLYVGGRFTKAGEVSAANIARWDGQTWHPLGSGVSHALRWWGEPEVYALAAHEGHIVAGGSFTAAGETAADRVARWDGHEWRPMGAGFQGPERPGLPVAVYELLVYRGQLVAAGLFLRSGSVELNGVGAWDGTQWTALSRGLDIGNGGRVTGLAVFDDGLGGGQALYVGGAFLRTGDGVASPHVARWGCPVCKADANNDGQVNQQDLGMLLADWGCTRGPGGCPGDADGDGDTDQADLGIVLANWGRICP